MKQIVLCPNPIRDEGYAYTKSIRDRFIQRGVTPEIYPLDYFTEERQEPNGRETTRLERCIRDADLLICFGGDGTILHLARSAAKYDIPILTVNLGNTGFIAELERKDTQKILDIALAERYAIEQRMMMDVRVQRQGETCFTNFALNDAVVSGTTRPVGIEVYGDGQMISKFSGDGLIVCTPTGSTAYSMSAGGPIIEPTAKNLSITPICAHALIAKSFVLAPDRIVTVKVNLYGGKHAYLSVDGGSFPLEHDDVIVASRSRHVTRLVKASEKSFYQIVNEKLGET